MLKCFASISELSKTEFIAAWEKEEQSRGHPDQYMDDALRWHQSYDGLKYYSGYLALEGLNSLTMPTHSHGVHHVSEGGEQFGDVIAKYWRSVQAGVNDDCLVRINLIKNQIHAHIYKLQNLSIDDYSLGRVYNDPQLAMPGHYRSHGKGKIYVGNFHRFVAYGLWMQEFGFQPIKVYYCENRSYDAT